MDETAWSLAETGVHLCDTCGRPLCAPPLAVSGRIQAFRCSACFARRPTTRTLVLRRLPMPESNWPPPSWSPEGVLGLTS